MRVLPSHRDYAPVRWGLHPAPSLIYTDGKAPTSLICLAHCCEAQLLWGPRDILGIKSVDKCCILAANSAEAVPGSVGMGGRQVVQPIRRRLWPLDSQLLGPESTSPSSQKLLQTSRKTA